jgi:hypothetical protein
MRFGATRDTAEVGHESEDALGLLAFERNGLTVGVERIGARSGRRWGGLRPGSIGGGSSRGRLGSERGRVRQLGANGGEENEEEERDH